MNQATILVVDDKPENIRLLFETLREGGYRTLAAVSGERAVRQAELARPDLILLDVMMPGIDGFETCRRLKTSPATRSIPVIFVTALGETVDKLKGFEAGGIDYLTKPLRHEEVLARVRAHLGRERLWRDIDAYSRLLLNMGSADSLPGAWAQLVPLLEIQPCLAGLAVWESTEQDPTLHLSFQAGFSADAVADIPGADPLLREAMESGRQQSAPSPDAWMPRYPGWAKTRAYRACIASPVACRDQIYGVLMAVYTGAGRDGFDEHLRWQSILARSLGNAIFQTRSLDTIREMGERLRRENEGLRAEIAAPASFDGMIGDSPALRRVLAQADLVAPTDTAVLIQGESGTGKELLAEWIHRRGPRRQKPLVRVNCAAIPSELFESEFFGHVQGAFTGAVRDRVGRFELADGGTLFLDEVGEIPLPLQGKLLRVLQEGTFERVGDTETRHTRVRVVAATNRDLRAEVRRGRFREDLFYRLGVFPLTMPPLRDRLEDLTALVRHFAAAGARKMGLPPPEIDETDTASLREYPWPGNIRELRNEVERTLILTRGAPGRFDPPHSPPPEGLPPADEGAIWDEKRFLELRNRHMRRALERAGWRVDGPGGAAEILGLRPTTLRSRMERYGIHRPV